MRKFLIFCFVGFFLSLTSNAQTLKNTRMIGGNGGINFGKNSSINLYPNLGYFIIDDLAIGSGVPIYYASFREGGVRTISGGVEPFIRHYFSNQAPLRIFAQINGAVGYVDVKSSVDEDFGSNYNFIQNSFGGGLGLVYFLTEQVGLEAKLNYNNFSNNGNTELSYPRNDNFSLTFGIQVHLPRLKK